MEKVWWKLGFTVSALTRCCPLSGDNYQGFSGMDERGENAGNQPGSSDGASANQGGISVPDFLPPAQRVLFMRIQQKQQEEEERARRMAEGGAEKSRDTEGGVPAPAPVAVFVSYSFVTVSCSPQRITQPCILQGADFQFLVIVYRTLKSCSV